jgi:hypothetical protein
MTKFNLFVLLMILLSFGLSNAQQIPGAAPGVTSTLNRTPNSSPGFILPTKIPSPHQTGDFVYVSTIYTFYDLVLFSYFDGSEFKLYDSYGTVIDSVTLDEDQFRIFSPGPGIYRLEGNASYTLLIGDPITNSVMGFYAVDEAGRTISTRLNTYMPTYEWGGERFIVFAYSDGTEFYIKDLNTGYTIVSGLLNAGEHFEMTDMFDLFLGVRSSKPVSVLSYADQGYYIPATNGTFAGTEFYGFSGYVGGWPNGIVITAYQDATDYLVINTVSGDTISKGILNAGQATGDYVFEPTYFKVTTSKRSTLFNTPYAYYNTSYYYLAVLIDEGGSGLGTNFYAPVIEGDLNLVSYENDNEISIYDMSNLSLVWKDTLHAGEGGYLYSARTVYHIIGTKNFTAINSWGGSFGACFVPSNFSNDLPDLSISSQDISFVPDVENRNQGDPISIQATVHNNGNQTAYNVPVRFYDGDPDGGYSISGILTVESITPGGSYTFYMDWTVPENPLYHAVYVSVDHDDQVIESNSSNNLAYKYIIPNNDFLPPLSAYIDAPASLMALNNIPEFNNFTVSLFIYNSGGVDATNVFAQIVLPDGLSLSDQDDSLSLGNQEPGQTIGYIWSVNIDNLVTDDAFYYSIKIGADNAPEKTLERRLLINRGLAVEESQEIQVPQTTSLKSNYPNPFNPATTIEYTVHKTAVVKIDIFDIVGRKIQTLVDETKSAGIYRVQFDGSTLVSGVYFISMQSDNFRSVRKMMLIK